jgi:hypothetical protein
MIGDQKVPVHRRATEPGEFSLGGKEKAQGPRSIIAKTDQMYS